MLNLIRTAQDGSLFMLDETVMRKIGFHPLYKNSTTFSRGDVRIAAGFNKTRTHTIANVLVVVRGKQVSNTRLEFFNRDGNVKSEINESVFNAVRQYLR